MTLTDNVTDIRRIERPTAMWCAIVAALLWGLLWFVLDRATDSPVPLWDGLIASLSVVATWMLTRKYIEQWYVWIFANAIAVAVYLGSGLYPTAVLFFVYFVMAIAGVREWNKSMAIR
jgi:nicotinamide mononucleotide transporter